MTRLPGVAIVDADDTPLRDDARPGTPAPAIAR
jgi:hypothetical protein